jgi:hypothetical protein
MLLLAERELASTRVLENGIDLTGLDWTGVFVL